MEKKFRRDLWIGMGILLLAHLIAVSIAWLVFNQPFFLLLIGVTQLVYCIPLSLLAIKWPGWVAGLWIGAGVTFLLNIIGCGIGLANFGL